MGAWGSGSDARPVHARDGDHAPESRATSRRRALRVPGNGLRQLRRKLRRTTTKGPTANGGALRHRAR
ncbi:hypothetical protein F3K43_23130 [Streptomyces sp. LBUM 1476]|nr:hypothetical protein [Streptomyces sp. LBUM 1476]